MEPCIECKLPVGEWDFNGLCVWCKFYGGRRPTIPKEIYSREFLSQVERLVRAIGTYACFKQVDLVRRAWYHDDLVRHRTSVPDISGPWDAGVPCGIRPEMTYAPVEPRVTAEEVQTALQTAARGYVYIPGIGLVRK